MLLLDLDYNGELFDLDIFFFGDQLESSDWIAKFDIQKIGEKVMAIWIDHFGNEFKAVITREAFGLEALERQESASLIKEKEYTITRF